MSSLYHDTYPVVLPELAHRLSDAIMLISWDNRLIFVNDAAAPFLPQDIDVIGRPIDHLLERQLYDAIAPALSDAQDGKDTQYIDLERKGSAPAGGHLRISVFPAGTRAGVVTMTAVLIKDITLLTSLSNDLADTKSKFKAMIDTVPQIIWENAPSGYALFFNHRWFEYTGLDVETSMGPGWPAVIHPDDAGAVVDWQMAFRAGRPFNSEGRLRRADGQYQWHLLRNIPLKDPEGHILSWWGTATNIDDLKQAEFRLRTTSERLRAILEAAIDFAIVTLDKDGYIIDWNSGAEKMFGHTRDEVLGKFTGIFFTPEDNEAGMPMQEITRAAKTGFATDERWHVHKDGSRFFMSGVMRPIIEGSITGYVKVARNITDRKLAEEALFLSEQRKNIAIQSTLMGEWDWDIMADIVQRNEHAANLLGMEKTEADTATDSFFCCIHPDDASMVRRQISIALDGLNIFQADYRIIRRDNRQPGWISSYGRVITHKDGRPSRMIGVSFDITARKNTEKQKDDFISVASHELKTPVTSIKGYSQLILQNLREQGDDDNIALLMSMNGQIDRLTKLLFTLLDTTSTLEGKLRLALEAFDINDMIAQEVNAFAIAYSGHKFIWNHMPIPMIQADKSRIRQVLVNVVSNAVKYSQEGTDIIISTEDQGDSVMVKVQDHGLGLLPEEQAKVFDRYYRGNNKPGNHQSFGLGLYISLEIIQQHHGTMGVESIKGKGSTFYFKLPYTS